MFEFSFTNRADAIYTKAELVVDDSGKPKQLPWEDWREGEDLLTSGWMRATAPSGDASFVGEVGWSNELGYGLRPAEPKQAEADRAKTVKTIDRGGASGETGHGGH
jgi:NADH-quinone oxidoreductase subunit I